MSMYTENISDIKIFHIRIFLTVRAGVDPADGGDGWPPCHYEQVIFTLVVSPLGLGHHEVIEVQSANIIQILLQHYRIGQSYYIP